mgnify:CR=1 FL=1
MATGQLALSTQLTPINEERLHLVSSITSKALALTYAGKTLTCDPALTADLLLTPTHLIATDIRQLQLSLPGVTLNGRGTLTNGTLSANILLTCIVFWVEFDYLNSKLGEIINLTYL